MGETNTLQVDSLQETGQASQGERGSTSKATKTYTEEQVAKAIEKARSDVLAESGRKTKVYEDENTTLKSQLTTNQTFIKEAQDRHSKLEKQIDDLSQDDPDKLRLTTKLRELDIWETKLKLGQDILTKAEETNRERLEKADKFELEGMAKQIAGDYKDGNSDRLLKIALKLADRSEAELRAVADTIWTKNEPSEEPEPEEILVPDSGMTSGGKGTLTYKIISKMSPDEKIRRNAEIVEFWNKQE